MSNNFNYRLDIDFLKPQMKRFTNIVYKELDENTSGIYATLYANSDVIDLTGYNVSIHVETPDKSNVTGYASVLNAKSGSIEIRFSNNMLTEGVNYFEVSLVKNGAVKYSSRIGYRVLEGIGDKGDISNDSNYPILINLIKDINASINRADRYSNTLSDKLADIENKTQKSVDATSKSIKATEDAKKATDRVNSAIASGTRDLEVKDARIDQKGFVHDCLSSRLNAIENNPYVYFEEVEG